MTIVICQECNDAPAVTRRRFSGPETAEGRAMRRRTWHRIIDAIHRHTWRGVRSVKPCSYPECRCSFSYGICPSAKARYFDA